MLPNDLLRPDAWPDPRPQNVELIETHVSWVFRGDHEVLKVKKPVSLGFLDFRTPDRRRAACDAEVRLNSRLAPDVYRRALPLVQRGDGTLSAAEPGNAVDWAVLMARLPDERCADVLLTSGRLRARDIDALASELAAFHSRAGVNPREASLWASPDALARNVDENFAQTRPGVERFVSSSVAEEARGSQTGFVRHHADLLESRVREGRIRDGHGDLRLEHVYFTDDGIRIIDCIEFDPRYRIEDVCCDVAFLAMDLEAHGRVDFAERFLARYARAANDYDIYALVDFYAGYRAWVRGKVAMLLADDEDAGQDARRRAAEQARKHFLLAAASSRAAVLPATFVCVGGIIGSGKSTVAEAIAEELSCCPVIDADRTRKHMRGVRETRHFEDAPWTGAYDPAFTELVYDEVLRRAAVVIQSGRPVIVDASFRSRAVRRKAHDLAERLRVPFRFVECHAPAHVCRERLQRRDRATTPSDATERLLVDFTHEFESVSELTGDEHIVVDTTRPLEQTTADLRRHMATWPRGLVR